MIVVADTSVLCYLVLIEQIELLHRVGKSRKLINFKKDKNELVLISMRV